MISIHAPFTKDAGIVPNLQMLDRLILYSSGFGVTGREQHFHRLNR